MYKSIKKILRAADSDYIWSKAAQQNSLHALPRDWPWDMARDRGIQGTRSLTAVLKVLSTPIFNAPSVVWYLSICSPCIKVHLTNSSPWDLS